jgi:hypothetical protein
MCGIGTFTHEFGHILDLPDFYDIYNSGHVALGYWDVMDTGCYLNNGRTPSGYSAYERFFLNWLTPRVINSAENDTLHALNTSNEALLVCQSGIHNLQGNNPNPKLFYLLENRQKTAWDTYLPGHGMLVTRINYDSYKWAMNEVNTNANAMGVDIMRAGGTAGTNLASDPFPGTRNITSYNIVFTDAIIKPLTAITEQSGVISFKFMGGTEVPGGFDNIQTKKMKIYSSENKIIIRTEMPENHIVQVFDISGIQLLSDTFSQTYELDRGLLPRGVYFVKIGEQVQKVLW